MKKTIPKNQVSLCLQCSNPVIPNIGTDPKQLFGFVCSNPGCGIKYILPPPVNMVHWKRTQKIYLQALENEASERKLFINLSEIINKDSIQ